jgi:GT2 family glycosyltransferase
MSTPMVGSVSVIVSAFTTSRMQELSECIEALMQQTLIPHEVLLVIDHNEAMLRSAIASFPSVHVVSNDHAVGCSGARNCGASHATGDIIAFIDDDAVADREWLTALTRAYADPTVLGTTGRMVPRWPHGRPEWFPPEFDWVVGGSYRGLPECTTEVRNLWGGTMSIRRAEFEKLGGFNERIGRVGHRPIGGEETEFAVRARRHFPSARYLYVVDALATHHIEAERTTFRYFLRRCHGEGVSKAAIAGMVRSTGVETLSTERSYALHVLPHAVGSEALRALQRDGGSLKRAAVILLGTGVTAGGYLSGLLRGALDPTLWVDSRPSNAVTTWGARGLQQGDADPAVSVIVSAFSTERMKLLSQCVSSITEQRYHPAEIILVIDHNRALFERARRTFAGVQVVENDHSQGCSGARNCGAEHAKGEILAFIDDDARADPGWLEQLVRPYADESVLGTTGYVRARWPTARPPWFPPEFDWVVGSSYSGMPDAPARVRNVWGVSTSLRRSLFEQLGGYDETIGRVGSLPVGCEDTEFCLRANLRYPDGTILYVPDAVVDHYVSDHRATLRYFMRRCYGEGLSKAVVAQNVGWWRGLSTERHYVTRVLPGGVVRGLRRSMGGDMAGLGSSLAIVAGVAAAGAGYVRGRLRTGVMGEP